MRRSPGTLTGRQPRGCPGRWRTQMPRINLIKPAPVRGPYDYFDGLRKSVFYVLVGRREPTPQSKVVAYP